MIIFSILLSLVTTGEINQGITADVRALAPYDTPSHDLIQEEPLPLRVVYDGETYDELSFHLLLPAQTAFVIRCDPGALTLADTLAPDYGLTPNAQAALEAAPAWLRLDLVDNLMQLGAEDQNTLADMILNPSDPRLRDEIAFQAAHISPAHLQRMNLSVITQNLDSLFAIDEELDYVEIVDYGDPQIDDDYYSTARYKALDNGSYVDVEIPCEIYYWYVIMPRITDELPKIIYEKFWREFLYYDNGTTSYTENPEGDPYPLLRDVLADIEFVWDGERHVWPRDREHSTDMGAINAIGWWTSRVLPRSATSPRPIQPSQIATDHDGNCGECQDLFCAGLRTGLIPALGVMDINEDHVWNAFWWPTDYAFPDEGGWYPCQVDLGGGVTHAADSGCAYDKDRGGGKYCSMIWNWRTDGYQYSSITTYSNCCTLTVALYDTAGRPVSNADVKLESESWHSPLVKYKGFAGLTDRNGIFTTTLGEEQNYYVTPYWEFLGQVIDSASSPAGSSFFISCTLSSNYNPQPRELDTEPVTPDPLQDIALYLEVNAEYDLGHCQTYSYEEVDSKSAVKFAPGQLTDFFLTDYTGLANFLNEQQFNTYSHFPIEGEGDSTLPLHPDEARYLVFFNNHADMGEVISGTISLVETLTVAVEIPVLQNPLLSQYIDIWVVPTSGDLTAAPQVTVTLNGNQESVSMQSVSGTQNYVGNYKFKQSGIANIDVTAGDVHESRTFSVDEIGVAGGMLASTDGRIHLEILKDAVNTSIFFTIIPEKTVDSATSNPYAILSIKDADGIGPAYRIGPGGVALSSPASIRVCYTQAELSGADPSTLVLMCYEEGKWIKVPSFIDRERREVVASVEKLGIFQLASDPTQSTPDLPKSLDLKLATSNPVEGQPLLCIVLVKETSLSLEVFDATGRRVRTLARGTLPAGEHEVRWDATDDAGNRLAAGIYFFRLKTPNESQTLKLVRLH